MKPSPSRVAYLHLRAGTPAGPALKFLQRARDKGKGSLNVNVLESALPLMRWSIHQSSAGIPIQDSDQLKTPLRPLFKASGVQDIHGLGVHDPKLINFDDVAKARNAVQMFKSLASQSNGPPRNPEVGRLYYQTLNYPVPSEARFKEGAFFTIGRAWLGTVAYEVFNEKGDRVLLPTKPGEDVLSWKPAKFWSWAYSNGLQEAAATALAAVGVEEVAKATAPKSMRSLEGTGTCPACGQNVKMTRNRIMRHGWQVQGSRSWGSYGNTWHTSSCFGVGYPPFEMDKVGAVNYREKAVEPSLERAQEMLKKFQQQKASGEPFEFFERGKQVVITPENRDYTRMADSMIRRVQSDIEGLTDLLRTLDAKVAGWQQAPLPGTR